MAIKIEAAQRLKAGRETGLGAGAIFYADATGRFLLVKRSETGDEPNTWCGLGGGVEPDEALEDAVRREAHEEAQYPRNAPCDLRYIGQQDSPDFTFHNYLAIVPDEFVPQLNHEHTDHQWVNWEDFPEEMHPKFMEALMSEDGQAVIRQHTDALGE